ncbi:hypothetical protein [Megalodesulfovibrio paquesii]
MPSRFVVFRDRQEFQAADLNNTQTFMDEMHQHLVMDAITAERMFVGLTVSKKSATELDMAAGRLWDGQAGIIYRKDQAETISIFSHLPLQDSRWLTLSVIGQEVETDLQPRDFLIDLQSGQTEPSVVAMERARTIAVLVTPGLESTDPQQPVAPTGYTEVAAVLLTVSGIQEVRIADNTRLMRLFDVWQSTLANAAWIAEAGPKLAAIMSDLAALAALIKSQSTSPLLAQLAAEVAVIRDKLALPATFMEYEADNFLVKDESDTTNPEFHALVQMGARFPWAGETEMQLAPFNPNDTSVKDHNGLILPAYEVVPRVQLTGQSGSLALSQYQFQTVTTRQCTRTRRRIEYSPTWQSCTNGQYWAEVDQARVVEEVFEGAVPAGVTLGDATYMEAWGAGGAPGHELTQGRQVWVHTWQEQYTVIDSVTESVNGSTNAQTFLNSSNGWLTGVGLTFTAKASTGPVYLYLMDTLNGLPNHHRTIGRAVVQPEAIKLGSETRFEFAEPVYLQNGRRYALVLVTGGNHYVALVSGTQYSQGTLFYSTDGEYFQGDFTKDLMFSLYYAQFKNPRTVLDLTPVSLSDGIAVFSLLHEAIVPDATDLTLEYQASGSAEWVRLVDGTTDGLLGLPAMCRLRAVFNGSSDVMPALGCSGSKLRARRAGTSFRHISTERALTQPSAEIQVILRLEGWDAAKHTCEVKLRSGAETYTGTVQDQALDATTIRRTVTFTPTSPEVPDGIASYKIQIEGTTTTPLSCFHVAQRMDVAL